MAPDMLLVEQGPWSGLAHRKQDLAMTKQQPAAVWVQTLTVCKHNPQVPLPTSKYESHFADFFDFSSFFEWVSVSVSCGCVTWPKGKNYPGDFNF